MTTIGLRHALLLGCVTIAGCQEFSPLMPRAALDTDSANEAQAALESGIERNRQVQTKPTDTATEIPKDVMDQLMPPLPGAAACGGTRRGTLRPLG